MFLKRHTNTWKKAFYLGQRMEVLESFKYLSLKLSKSHLMNLTGKYVVSRATFTVAAAKNIQEINNLLPVLVKGKFKTVYSSSAKFWLHRPNKKGSNKTGKTVIF